MIGRDTIRRNPKANAEYKAWLENETDLPQLREELKAALDTVKGLRQARKYDKSQGLLWQLTLREIDVRIVKDRIAYWIDPLSLPEDYDYECGF